MHHVRADLEKNTNIVTGVNNDESPNARQIVIEVFGIGIILGVTCDL